MLVFPIAGSTSNLQQDGVSNSNVATNTDLTPCALCGDTNLNHMHLSEGILPFVCLFVFVFNFLIQFLQFMV